MPETSEKAEQILDASIQKVNAAMISHARQIAEEVGATAVLVYVDMVKAHENLETLLKEK